MRKGIKMATRTTEEFTTADYADHVLTYRLFVKAIAIAAGTVLFTLIVLAYATLS
jgi:hypothetical protein